MRLITRKRGFLWLVPVALVMVLGLASQGVLADSITVDGKIYTDVVVREGVNRYYIQLPDEGTIVSVDKASVPSDQVQIEVGAERERLQNTWEQNSPYAEAKEPEVSTSNADTAAAKAKAPQSREPIQITNIPKAGSQATEAPQAVAPQAPLMGQLPVSPNGTYANLPTGAIRAPQNSRTVTRAYELKSANDTLPKIVVHNQGGRSAAVSQGSGGGFGGGNFGGGGFGGAGAYGGAGGGFGGGGFGGGGFGGGGFGGGGYGGARGFSNISDLFFSIDDRLVGETPAVIGLQISVSN